MRMRLGFKKKVPRNAFDITVKIFLVIFLFVSLMAIVYTGVKPYRTRLREGDIALRDIYAPFNFTYEGEIDEKATEALRQEAAAKITPVYQFDSSRLVKAEDGITGFFATVTAARRMTELFGDDMKLKELRSNAALKLSDGALLSFIRTDDIGEVEGIIKSMVYGIADRGILRDEDRNNLRKKKDLEMITVYDSSSGVAEEIDIKSLLTVEDARGLFEKDVDSALNKDRKLKKATLELAFLFLEPNLKPDPERTQKKKEEALTKITPVYKEILVKKNELLLGRGMRISKPHLKKLNQLNLIGVLKGKVSYLIGLGLILAIFLAMGAVYLRIYKPKIFNNNRDILLITLNIIFIAILSEVIVLSPWSSYLIPLASVAMVLTILISADVAFPIVILMSIFSGIVAGNIFGLTIALLAGGFVGVYAVRKIRRRAQLFVAGLLVGVTNFLCIVGIGYLNDLLPGVFLVDGGVGFLNGLLSFFIVMGGLPILEALFKIPTNITLLELSDLNHPLLKEMVMRAPGTYHHSMMVGNLAEAACDAIGANSLLARVGAYYHDIGKIEKPEYFTENETDPNSRHEGLTPSMSALVITGHVKEGTELARKHKLNPVLIDFIEQHHGQSLIYYFYQKALEKGMSERELKEEEFRYPGPKPQTKEAATVLLADSVEASSRTLANPIPSRIKELVQRIINNKFIDNQLDECDLTLRDLNKIAESFVRTLSGVFHTRVEYPKGKEKNVSNRNNKPNRKENSSGPEPEKSDKKSP